MNIIISGLTAAGKTTHCKLLADKFKLRNISAASILAKESGIDASILNPTDSSFWISSTANSLNSKRKQDITLDLSVDATLKDLADKLENAVFDTLGLPWISSALAIRIWLESSFESRLYKALVSHQENKDISEEYLCNLIKNKDDRDRNYFLSIYNFDINSFDKNIFNLVVDISTFIQEPTSASSEESIKLTDDILTSFIGWYLTNSEVYKIIFQNCFLKHGERVFMNYPCSILD